MKFALSLFWQWLSCTLFMATTTFLGMFLVTSFLTWSWAWSDNAWAYFRASLVLCGLLVALVQCISNSPIK